MVESLRSKTFRGLSWSFIDLAGGRVVQFVIGIILARLLFPEQFGLVGMLSIFISVSQCFLDSGFGAALIQKREVTHTDTCSIFYFNILVGLTAAGLLCLIAPWISAFFNQPVLTPIARALSLTIVIDSFGLIQGTILTRKIDFKTQTHVSLIANILSGVIGVVLAVFGFGVWSIVFQQISRSFIQSICLWIFNPWRPSLIFSIKALGGMFGYSSKMLLTSILNRIFENIYFIVIGKLFSARELGLYTRGKVLQELPANTLSEMVTRVTFPVFSSIQDDLERVRNIFKKVLTNMVLVSFPMMIGLALIARPLVLVILTEKWAGAIPYVRLLCITSLTIPLSWMNMNILTSLGRSDLLLRLQIINKLLIIVNIAATWRYGIIPMIYGMMAVAYVSYFINSYTTGGLIGYSVWRQWLDLFPYLIMALLMGIAVFYIDSLPLRNMLAILLIQISTGIVVYVSLCRIFRLSAFMKIWDMGWNRTISERAL